MDLQDKILPFDHASDFFDGIRAAGKKLVQCHGTFDLLHSGHICHLQESKRLGDVLVVTVTGDEFVNKGPGRPYLNEQLRTQSLAALHCVDYVVSIPHPAAKEAIECVKPNYYCKGTEYKNHDNDVMGNIQEDVQTVEKLNGKVHYLGSNVMSSTQILNNHFDVHQPEVKHFCKALAESITMDQFKNAVNALADTKVLVIGDIIFDQYSYLSVQGLTSKNRILSGRFLDEEIQAGGALAVYRHLKEFSNHVKLVSLVGEETETQYLIDHFINKEDNNIITDPDFTTIIKQRFLERTNNESEITKLFSINYIDGESPSKTALEKVRAKIAGQIKDYDLVLVLDFGHGLMSQAIRDLVQAEAPFLALNCQTNSNNFGFNVINRRYQRADSFSLDQQEIMLAIGDKDLDYKESLEKLNETFKAKYGWLTRGSVTTLGKKVGQPIVECPALEHNCIDAIGAGDAFCAVASLAAANDYPIELSTFLGQLAGAQAVTIVGNSKPINKKTFLKSGISLLNF